MFCPNCGKETSAEQRFCRACGLGLEKIVQAVDEQLPTQLNENLLAQKNRYEWWGMIALSIFGLGVLGAILFGIVYKMMIVKGEIVAGLFILGFIVIGGCGLLSTILFAKANEAAEAATKRRSSSPEGERIGEKTETLLPDGHLEPLPSVTERTTDLLLANSPGDKQKR